MTIETSNQPWLDPNYVVACVHGCIGLNPDGYAGLVDVATNTLELLGQIKPDELSDSRPLQHKLACMIMGACIELRQALENAKKGV